MGSVVRAFRRRENEGAARVIKIEQVLGGPTNKDAAVAAKRVTAKEKRDG
jgi:hypothetical protein